jgi:hypothetical protein
MTHQNRLAAFLAKKDPPEGDSGSTAPEAPENGSQRLSEHVTALVSADAKPEAVSPAAQE